MNVDRIFIEYPVNESGMGPVDLLCEPVFSSLNEVRELPDSIFNL